MFYFTKILKGHTKIAKTRILKIGGATIFPRLRTVENAIIDSASIRLREFSTQQ